MIDQFGEIFMNSRGMSMCGESIHYKILNKSLMQYKEVVKWRKNIFLLSSGAAGKSYIRETTRFLMLGTKIPKF